jgi:DNA processing protein
VTGEELDWLRLHLTPGLGRAGLVRLMAAFGPAASILAAPASAWKERAGVREAVARAVPAAEAPSLQESRRALDRVQARLVVLTDSAYPPLLRAIHDPPAILYVMGTLPGPEALAVVGSRRASEVGRRLATAICTEIAARGIAIVSGLARGIDTAAHHGALAGGGATVGVLGCGIDQVYPPENAKLFVRMLERGAIVSEYPPGTPPLAGHFPGRNRIISGLCRGVLVVEAAEGSGSLITAEFALEQGREVFAIPGSVASPVSCGVNQLLKDGAHLVTGPDDILQSLWPQVPSPQTRTRTEAIAAGLSGNTLDLFRLLGDEPRNIDELVRSSGLTPMDVSAILLHLELQGAVETLPGMRFVRAKSL